MKMVTFFKIQFVIPTVAAKFKNIEPACNASQSNLRLLSNNTNINIKLRVEAIIKVNKRTFNSIAAANKYIKTFIFRKNCFFVQVKTVEKCKTKIE